MDIDRNTIIGLLLVGLVIAFTYTDYYKKLIYNGAPPPPPKKVEKKLEKQESLPPQVTEAAPEEQVEAAVSEEPVPQTSKAEQRVAESIISDFKLAVAEVPEQEIEVETPLYRAVFSNRGPSLKSWMFKNYMGPDSLPYEMVQNGQGNLSLSLPVQEDTLALGNFTFSVEAPASKIRLGDRKSQGQVTFRLDLGQGKIIEQEFTFYADRYSFDMRVKIAGMEDVVDGFAYGVNWKSPLNSSERNFNEDMNYTKAYALTANDIEEFDVKNKKIAVGGADDWIIRWAAVRTKYFATAIIPTSQNGNGVKFVGTRIPLGEERYLKAYALELRMPYLRQATEDRFTIYAGPLQYSIVKSYGVQLEKMMNFGWKIIRPISKFVLWSLTHLYSVIPNYGLVIIIFSILVKIVLYPLTKKSYKSMKEMQRLQPEMQRLREKYKDDPQKLNAEVMKLYREYGVNPLGGCLPMLLQMPLLYALFIVFRTTIELRGAPFVAWITDLSNPDTIFTLPFSIPLYGNGVNVLPIIMGATMFLQQKMSVQDPKQKAMVYFMPIFFTLLFNNFPSGLTLYYTLFNVFSLIQQKMISTEPHDGEAGPAPKKKARKPRNRYEALRQMRRQ